ncbi:glycosyltransferase family 2 protein [Corallococcus sp. Z5C101001]|uniref:glycosyltransferase family 2 protein n=1 Tax=Corallococcus sp. Z5C101001 TaxID=2596829 RepID=UPI00117EED5B|nr:glycosyltransferase [Corallococcus sp. Z5C101001]TSC32672.1 glycosyltransferase [Corallococcus sp. Z5C101001]
MTPDVSVVVPTFRRPALVVEAVRSALSQDGVRVEVQVLDDSPEGSAREAVLALGNARVRYVKRDVPTGGNPATVRNEGWPGATGRYLHFLDDDDRVAPGAYQALARALDAHPERGVAFGRVEPFGDDPAVLARQTAYFEDAARRARVAQRLGSRRWMVANMLFRPTVLVNSACLIRRELLPELGGYDTRLPLVEDVDFYLRAIRRAGAVFLDRAVLEYRTGAPSLMHNERDASKAMSAYRLIHERYRREWGAVEHTALKLATRTVLRWL